MNKLLWAFEIYKMNAQMKNKNLVLLFLLLMVEGWLLSAAAQSKSSVYKPWSHGQLKVSKENRYLMNADGTPFSGWGIQDGCYPRN